MREHEEKGSGPPVVVTGNSISKAVWLVLGFIFVGIGFIGILVPGLPTTPLMILAAACFARSSPRFYKWVINNRVFGAQVRRFREGSGISVRGKLFSTTAMTFFIGLAVVWGIPDDLLWVKGLTLAAGIVGVVYILRQPTHHS
jgi:uncharacterized membrane protein YbaN (DUF454 family)